jgi:hypothetical protein
VILRSRGGLAEASNTSTRKTFSGRVIHKIFHADEFKSFLKSKKFVSQVESNPRVPAPKRSPFNAACPFSRKVTFVSTRPGILRSRRILNHAKPSITAGGMKKI